MEDLLRELIEFVKSASPMIWETFRRQVQVEIFQLVFWTVVLLAVSLVCTRLAYKTATNIKTAKEENKDRFYRSDVDEVMILMFSLTASVAALTIGLMNISDAISRIINPDFYTIQLILEQLK